MFQLTGVFVLVPQSLDEENTKNETSTLKPLIVKSVEKSGLPEEVQMAQCTVQSGDIKASAQATFSQKLENVCSTSEYNKGTNLKLCIILSVIPKELYKRVI